MAFTEQGVAMLSSVLKSKRAIDVNIAIMRGFVKMRKTLSSKREFSEKLKTIEDRLGVHDEQCRIVSDVIKQLLQDDDKPKRKIGFFMS